MIMCGSSFSDGNRHDPNNLPILLGGKGGGRLQTGQHLANDRNTPLCNLYVSMLDCMGIPVHAFRRQHRGAEGVDGMMGREVASRIGANVREAFWMDDTALLA